MMTLNVILRNYNCHQVYYYYYSSSSSVYSLRPNNLVQEEHIYNTYKYKSSEVQTNRYIFIQGKNINKKEQTIESLLMLDFSIKDHNRKTTKRSRQHQKFLK